MFFLNIFDHLSLPFLTSRHLSLPPYSDSLILPFLAYSFLSWCIFPASFASCSPATPPILFPFPSISLSLASYLRVSSVHHLPSFSNSLILPFLAYIFPAFFLRSVHLLLLLLLLAFSYLPLFSFLFHLSLSLSLLPPRFFPSTTSSMVLFILSHLLYYL